MRTEHGSTTADQFGVDIDLGWTLVGNPRLVAGFSDAYFEESDGSAGSFFGTFVALSEPFRVSGK